MASLISTYYNPFTIVDGTLRERVKVQRGWKSMKSQLAEGQRIQYNFVKPHLALDGQTPAQTSGISIEDKNKWLELLRKAKETTGSLR